MDDSKNKEVRSPIRYSPETGKYVCDVISTSTISLKKLHKLHNDFPEETTVLEWRKRYQEFADLYTQAKMSQAEMFADEIIELSDEAGTYIDAEGNERVDTGSVAKQRLRIDTRKWIASRLAPKVYGDKLHTVSLVSNINYEEALKELE